MYIGQTVYFRLSQLYHSNATTWAGRIISFDGETVVIYGWRYASGDDPKVLFLERKWITFYTDDALLEPIE